MIYIDCDGVIFDSEKLLFNKEYYKLEKQGLIKNEEDKINYIKNINWDTLLNNSEIINNSIEILKKLKYEFSILTKVHSLKNEGVAKIKIFRKYGIKNDIVLVPYTVNKNDVVNPINNILIDDTVNNLNLWRDNGGISIYFNKDNLDIDGWNVLNTEYIKIYDLNSLNNIKKLIKIYKCN